MKEDYQWLSALESKIYYTNTAPRIYKDKELFNIFKSLESCIEDAKFSPNMYMDKIVKIVNQEEIDEKIEVFSNASVSYHWVRNQNISLMNQLLQLEDTIKDSTSKIIESLTEKENHSLLSYVNDKVDNILNIFKDKKYQEILNKNIEDILKFQNIIEGFDNSIIESKNNIIASQESKWAKPVYNTKISENNDLEPLFKFQIKHKNKINEYYKNNIATDLTDLLLIKNLIRNDLKSIHKYCLENGVGFNNQDEKYIELKKENISYKENKYLKVGEKFSNDFLINRNGEILNLYDNIDVKEVIEKEFNNILRSEFNKNPNIVKFFININKNIADNGKYEFSYIKNLDKLIKDYLNKKEILDNYKFDLFENYKNSMIESNDKSKNNKRFNYYKIFEIFEDKIKVIMKEHQIKLMIKSISSNKYDKLFNEESNKIVGAILDLDLNKDIFQQYIGKKLAKYKSSEELNSSMDTFLKSFSSFNRDSILNKAFDSDTEIAYDDEKENLIILKINNYKESVKFGSSSWCISTNENYFESYTKNDQEQYFVYDFKRDQKDEFSLIGITVDRNGEFSAGYLKDDTEIEEDSEELSYNIDLINEYRSSKKIKNKNIQTNKI